MIKINLLPTENAKAERTPLPRFPPDRVDGRRVLHSALLQHLHPHPDSRTKDDIATEQATLRGLEPFVQEHDKLLARQTELQNKVREIEGLISRDVEDWRTVNALWDVIHQNPASGSTTSASSTAAPLPAL